MRRCAGFCVVPVIVLGLVACAWADMHRIPVSERQTGIELVDRTDDALVFRMTVGELTAMDVQTNEGTFSQLLLPGAYTSDQLGKPALPMMNRLFEIPYGAQVDVRVLSYETHEVALADFGIQHPLLPAQPSLAKDQDPESVPFRFDRDLYARDSEYSLETARAVDTGWMRSVRIGRLETAPVSYNPVAGTLTVRENIEVEVSFTGGDLQAELMYKARTWSPFFECLYDGIGGYRHLHAQHPDLFDGPAGYVIISSPLFQTQLQPFVAWKKQQGFTVVEGYTNNPNVGTTTTSIRAYIQNLYNTMNPAPTFVLFCGDIAEIPAYSLSGTSDLTYCDMTGDDIPEMYYGRFSASNTTDMQKIIDKTLEYEQYGMPDPSYLNEVVMIAGMDATYGPTHANGQINYGTNLYFNLAHGITSHTHLYPNSGSQAAQIVQEVSNGVSYVNYTAHGSTTSWSDPSFTISNVNSLQNAHEWCLAVGNCCLAASYEVGTCFAEAWIRSANGAIGYIGGSESTYWNEDYYWGVGYGPVIGGGATYEQTEEGAYDGMFHDHGEAIGLWYVCQDAHIFCGNLAVQESGSSLTSYYWEIYNLMGDPSLSVYLSEPDANPVTLPAQVIPSDTYMTVHAAPKSYVGLTKSGVLLGSGLVGESGVAEIPMSGQGSSGQVRVTVTCQNRIPYVLDVPISSHGPYLVVDHNQILDTTYGDGDGVVDVGEQVSLSPWLKNQGQDPATTTVGVIAEGRAVNLIDPTAEWGTILASQNKAPTEPFDLMVLPGTPDQTPFALMLTVTCAETTFNLNANFVVEAPVVGMVQWYVDDSVGGDGDGTAEPGETLNLSFTLANTGHEDATNATAVLWEASPYLTVDDSEGSLGLLAAGGQAFLSGFTVTVASGCPAMTTINLHLDVSADFGYAVELGSPLPVSPFFENFENEIYWTVSGNATTGMWSQGDPEGTTYNSQPCQPEDDHTPSPGRRCMVTDPRAGSSASTYDVDNGSTYLTSPAFDMSEAISATVEYWRWYTNNLGGGAGEDYWSAEVSNNNGATWTYLEHTQASAAYWQKFSFQVESYVPLTSQMKFRFTAADLGTGSLVEAAMDDFLLFGVKEEATDAADGGIGIAASRFELLQNRPNPFNPETEIAFRLASSGLTPTTLKVYDTTGRCVSTLVNEALGGGEHRVSWNGLDSNGQPVASGVYFYRLVSGDREETRKMILLK